MIAMPISINRRAQEYELTNDGKWFIHNKEKPIPTTYSITAVK